MGSPAGAPELTSLRRFILPGLFVLVLFAALVHRRPDPAPPRESIPAISLEGEAMGTTWLVRVRGAGSEAEAKIREIVLQSLRAVDASMSNWREDSEISRLNRAPVGEAFPLSAPLQAVLREAAQVHGESGGAFDVTVAPLVRAWGFGPGAQVEAPDGEALKRLRARVGMDRLSLDFVNGEATRRVTGVEVDLSAIAKGHGVDRVAAALRDAGHGDHLVEIGGEVRAGGRGAGAPWRVAIEAPTREGRSLHGIVLLEREALATSGDYRNFRAHEGGFVSHILDPRTGSPTPHSLASVTVITESCTRADALATALMALGPRAGLALAEQLAVAALFIERGRDGSLIASESSAFTGRLRPAPASP